MASFSSTSFFVQNIIRSGCIDSFFRRPLLYAPPELPQISLSPPESQNTQCFFPEEQKMAKKRCFTTEKKHKSIIFVMETSRQPLLEQNPRSFQFVQSIRSMFRRGHLRPLFDTRSQSCDGNSVVVTLSYRKIESASLRTNNFDAIPHYSNFIAIQSIVQSILYITARFELI